MKDKNTIHTTEDRDGNPVTYGILANCTFLEITVKGDRSAIYGNDKNSRERMQYEICQHFIQIPRQLSNLFAFPVLIDA